MGRVPVIVTLDQLDEEALARILTEPKSAIVKQYQRLFELDDVQLEFTPDALTEIARLAMERKTGARGLRAILEKTMTDIMYEVPSDEAAEKCIITADVVRGNEEPEVVHNETAKGRKGGSNVRKAVSADNGIA